MSSKNKVKAAISRDIVVTVLTIAGQPTFIVPAGSTPSAVRRMVAHRYGYADIGIPHSWHGIPCD